MCYLIFLLLFSLKTVSAATDDYNCDMMCHFTDPYITAENYRNWPKWCRDVCGDLVINEKTDVALSDLEKMFHRVERLYGDLKVENTNFTSLSFLSNIQSFACYSDELILSNNHELTDLKHIKNLKANRGMCILTVVNNTKLDFTTFMNFALQSQMELNIHGNLKNAGCQSVRITPKTLPDYSNCTSVSGGSMSSLIITDVDQSTDLSKLSYLEKVIGDIVVRGTSLQNLSFLGNLRTIVPGGYEYSHNIVFIDNNPKLTRLGWDSLETFGSEDEFFDFYLYDFHDDFCLTTRELQVLAESRATCSMHFKFSPCPGVPRSDGQKVCIFESLSTLEPDCQHVIGNVVIDSTNEKYVSNLKSMTHIYDGLLKVEGTEELTDLSFLTNFRQLVTSNTIESWVIKIFSNKKLQKVEFPSMKTPPFPYSQNVMIRIDDNVNEIFKSQEECKKLENDTQTPVKYNGKGCDKLPAAGG